ncbi:MAG TPA: Asp23/Gls24 family envelope stress response protein [Anaerolineae bacterium]|nr:Asp23/Gls24 family envelope stress response protein [Anaerolineae bacterium]
MSTSPDNSLGKIDISPTAVATITHQAINQCYGVVGMTSKNRVEGLTDRLTRDPHRGIDVVIEDDGITITVYVIVQYGSRIRVVAQSIQKTVKFHIEKALGLPVKAVDVHVQGLGQVDNSSR